MADGSDDDGIAFVPWDPARLAVAVERIEPPEGTSRPARIVRHPTAPFVASVPVGAQMASVLPKVARAYLEALDAFLKGAAGKGEEAGLGLPAGWLPALGDPDTGPGGAFLEPRFEWLPVWPPFGTATPVEPPPRRLASWRLLGSGGSGGDTVFEGTVVMVAMEHLGLATPVDRDAAITVPVALRRDGERTVLMVRAMTAELPLAPYFSATEVAARTGRKALTETAFERFAERFRPTRAYPKDEDPVERALANALQLKPGTAILDDIRIRWRGRREDAVPEAFELRGKARGALPGRRGGRESFSFTLAFDAQDGSFVNGAKQVLSTGAAADVFQQDPASSPKETAAFSGPVLPAGGDPPRYDWSIRRPARRDRVLDHFRAPAAGIPLALETADLAVLKCPDFVPEDIGKGVKSVDLSGGTPPPRRNDFTALMAFWNFRAIFTLIDGLDIDLATLFVATERKIYLHYRSGITPGTGKDGQTINARVHIHVGEEGEANGSGVGTPPGTKRIEVHFALADLYRRTRPPKPFPQGSWAQPLGIADAMRWCLHEFGHVLIAARFDELEFPFAHSMGDALAAVLCDPFSRLADIRGEVVSPSRTATLPFPASFRGRTFPWVFIPRRHDRVVTLGWAWRGTLNRSLLDAPATDRAGLKGYVTEQILSTTAFRLYRILGGDTVRPADGAPDLRVRQRAAGITVYLLVEALRSSGPMPSEAEVFEAQMEAADANRVLPLALPALFAAGPAPPPLVAWRGGTAHKVVRWSFEAQGMFPADIAVNTNRPGLPPPVDLYVPDRRPRDEPVEIGRVRHGPGGYVPVSLDWDEAGGGALWLADPAALSVDGAGFRVTVRNRGADPATDVRLRWWVGLVMNGTGAGWEEAANGIDWLAASSGSTAVPGSLADEAEVPVAAVPPAAAPGATGWLLLVEIDCPADRANTSEATLLAPSIPAGGMPPTMPMHLVDIVAVDNNLGLRVLPFPGGGPPIA